MIALQDIRYAWRGLWSTPLLSAIAIATLALGIGANTAIFSIVDAIVFRPLPFADPERLVRVTADFSALGAPDIGLSPPELWDYRDRSGLFESIAAFWPINANLTEVDQPERVEVLLASPSYFDVLGVKPQLGRLFAASDDAPGISEVVVISDALWRRRFGGTADAIGKKLRIDDDTYTVVGVLPAGFRHPGRSVLTDVDLWAPANFRAAPFPSPAPRGGYFLTGAVGRLRQGVSVAEGQSRLRAFGAALRAAYPNDYPPRSGWEPRLEPLQDSLTGPIRPALVMTFAAVGVVLLIACVNIANLLLARASYRRREFAVRRALGASPSRIAGLLFAESLMLAVLGAVAASAVTGWFVAGLMSIAPKSLPRLNEVAINGRVLLFTAVIAIGTAFVFGLLPALQSSRATTEGSLKDFGRTFTSPRSVARSVLVISEVALAVVVLVGAALLMRSFWQLERVDPGFVPRHVLTARIWLPQPNDPSRGRYFRHDARLAVFDDILRSVRALPGVEGVAAAGAVPLDGTRANSTITVEGQEEGAATRVPAVQTTMVSPGYFELMGIRLLGGRTFTDRDDQRASPAIVISEAMARRYWPGGDPIGRRLHLGGPRAANPWLTVVGVVNDIRSERLEEPARPTLYRSLRQVSSLSLTLVVQTTKTPSSLGPSIARAVRGADGDLPVYGIRTMQEIVDNATASRRFATELVGGFALVALLLAAVGIYGVMAFVVGQRMREIGLRIALGARPSRVVAGVLAQALWLAGAGIGIGALAAMPLSRLMRGLLFNVHPADPVSYAAIAGVLAATAAIAAWRPAARAARVDPMHALRME